MSIHPFSFILLIFFGIYLLIADKKKIFIPILFVLIFIPLEQKLYLGAFDLPVIRLLFLIAWLRVFLTKAYTRYIYQRADLYFILYITSRIVVYTIAVGSLDAFIYQIGIAFDEIGTYFFFRVIITDLDDIRVIPKILLRLAIPTLIFFSIEKATGYNPFSILGGVPEFTMVREGKLRVQGAFSHPILAGTFWALLSPFMSRFLFKKTIRERNFGRIGFFVFIVLIFLTASSTPYMILLSSVIGIVLFSYRFYPKKMFRTAVAIYIFLEIVMKGPPYSLVAKIDITGGSTGWHRFAIIHNAIIHFRDWAVLGLGGVSTEYWGWGLWDVTNQFVIVAIQGGISSLTFYILVLVEAVSSVHKGLIYVEGNLEKEKDIWTIWTMLMIHIVAMMVISYFGQLQLIYLLTLAIAMSSRNTNDGFTSSSK